MQIRLPCLHRPEPSCCPWAKITYSLIFLFIFLNWDLLTQGQQEGWFSITTQNPKWNMTYQNFSIWCCLFFEHLLMFTSGWEWKLLLWQAIQASGGCFFMFYSSWISQVKMSFLKKIIIIASFWEQWYRFNILKNDFEKVFWPHNNVHLSPFNKSNATIQMIDLDPFISRHTAVCIKTLH